jgi:hypothetical protein
MSLETVHKLKKFFIFTILGILAVSVIFAFFAGLNTARKSSGDSYNSSIGMSAPSFSRDKLFSPESISGVVTETTAPAMPPSANPAFDSGSAASPDPIIVDKKLMQDGNLVLVVNKVEEGVSSLSVIAKKYGGDIAQVDYRNSEDSDKKRATVILRVPATSFQNALTDAKALALSIVSENVTTRDVTEQFVDMQARLKTLKATEEQYLEIMQKTTRVEDTLNVSRYLSDVRVQIEQLQGQMNYISRLVDMSVITVYLSSEPEINPAGVVWSPKTTANEAMKSFVSTFYSFVDAMIKLVLFYLPMLILLGLFVFLVFLLYVKLLRPWYEASKDLLHF